MIFSFAHADTGLFSSKRFDGSKRLVALNTPPGHVAIEGEYDRRTQRFDPLTGKVVAYQRPQAEVNAERRAARQASARQAIADLELKQLRPIRELMLDQNNAEARQRLQKIEENIAARRADLSD